MALRYSFMIVPYLHVGTESQVYGFRVGLKAVCRDLDDRLVAAGWKLCASLAWRLGEHQPAGNVHHEPAGVVGRPLADQEGRHELGLLVDAGPDVNVALVVLLGPLVIVSRACFLPTQVHCSSNCKMRQRQAPHSLVEKPPAGIAEVTISLRSCSCHAGDALGGPDALPSTSSRRASLASATSSSCAERLGWLHFHPGLAAELAAVSVFPWRSFPWFGSRRGHKQSSSRSRFRLAALARMGLSERPWRKPGCFSPRCLPCRAEHRGFLLGFMT